jgi:hypothetical protein
MKKVIMTLLMILLVATLVLANEAKTMMLKGYIVDNKCSGKQTEAQMDEFIKTHSKECAISEECKISGYSIYADHKLYKFDKKSNEKVAEFLQKPDTKLLVVAEVKEEGKEVSLISIKNEE